MSEINTGGVNKPSVKPSRKGKRGSGSGKSQATTQPATQSTAAASTSAATQAAAATTSAMTMLVQNQTNPVLKSFISPIFSGQGGDVNLSYGKAANNPDGAQTKANLSQGNNYIGSTSTAGGVKVDTIATASPRFSDGNIARSYTFPVTFPDGKTGKVVANNGVVSYTAPDGTVQTLSAQNPEINIAPGVTLTLENSVGKISQTNPPKYNDPEMRFVLRVDDTGGNPNKAPLEISGAFRNYGSTSGSGAYTPNDPFKSSSYPGTPYPPGTDSGIDMDFQRVAKVPDCPPPPVIPEPPIFWIPDPIPDPAPLPPDCPPPPPPPPPPEEPPIFWIPDPIPDPAPLPPDCPPPPPPPPPVVETPPDFWIGDIPDPTGNIPQLPVEEPVIPPVAQPPVEELPPDMMDPDFYIKNIKDPAPGVSDNPGSVDDGDFWNAVLPPDPDPNT